MRRAEYNDPALKKLPIRKLVVGVAIAVAGLAIAIGALSLPWHGSRPAGPPRLAPTSRGSGPLRAGAAAVSIDLPPGAPIGGYARLSWRSEGIRDPVGARAVYLEVPGCRAAVVSADVLLVSEALVQRIEALVSDLGLDALLVGATHTHAGPGGFRDDVAFERGALGPYDARIFELLARRMAEAVRLAAGAAAPARLTIARGTAEQLVKARSGGRVDGRMASVRLVAEDGEAIGELLVFAAHPTILGKANRLLSAEWPGRVAAQPGRGVRVFVQGALGDQSVRVQRVDEASAPERYAAAVIERDDALPALPEATATVLATAAASVDLPAVSPGAVPSLLRRAASSLGWSHVPATARVTALRIGPLLLVAVPAEPTAEVGAGWRAAAGDDAEIVSLVGGYAGYVDTPERTALGVGESVRTYYGPDLAPRLEAAIRAAAGATAR